jgi:hypothetical protein
MRLGEMYPQVIPPAPARGDTGHATFRAGRVVRLSGMTFGINHLDEPSITNRARMDLWAMVRARGDVGMEGAGVA